MRASERSMQPSIPSHGFGLPSCALIKRLSGKGRTVLCCLGRSREGVKAGILMRRGWHSSGRKCEGGRPFLSVADLTALPGTLCSKFYDCIGWALCSRPPAPHLTLTSMSLNLTALAITPGIIPGFGIASMSSAADSVSFVSGGRLPGR